MTTTLVAAVRACLGGAVYVDPGVRSSARWSEKAAAAMPVAASAHEPLTTIEVEVLQLFASASTMQRIAEQLGVDLEEAIRVKQQAMRKLGFTTRLQVMNYVRSGTMRA